jgi:outer membrane protein insertion porin family
MTYDFLRRHPGSTQRFAGMAAGAMVLLLLLLILAAPAAAQQKTLFLPLKINAPADDLQLTELADQALQETVRARGEEMLAREEAKAVFPYDETWPPSREKLRAFAAGKEIDYLAVGSVTRAGAGLSIDMAAHDLLAAAPPEYFYAEAPAAADLDRVLASLAEKVLAYAGRSFLIATVEVTGNERIDAGAILRNIHSTAGSRYQPDLLREDLKKVFGMGYFEDIKIDVADTERGKKVTFIVEEKPVIGQIVISGDDEVKNEDIREVITLRANNIINPREVQESVENIRRLYKEKGFYNTEVTARLTHPKPDRVNVEFAIEEGEKVFVRKIDFVGNEAFSNKELRKVVATSKKGFFSWLTDSGVLKREVVEQDAARINAFYNNNGYVDAAVGEPEIKQDGKWLYVTFNISEGERYEVGKVELGGDLIASQEQLMPLVKLTKEKFFSRKVLREDLLRLTDHYADSGYAFADATPSIDKDPRQKKVDVTINLSKGNLVHINRITIRGNTRTRDKIIRRRMEVAETDIFNAGALKASNANLQRLGYFEEVNITPQPTATQDLMDILVEVKERPTGSFSIGAGYSSVDQLLFMAEISQDNFLGKGQRLSLQANLSGSSARYNLGFTEPHFNDSKLLVGFDLYDWRREYDDYTRDSYGFALRFGYPVWERWRMFWSYSYDETVLKDVSPDASDIIRGSQDINLTSAFRLAFERDTRNRGYDATRGSVHSVNVKYAGGPLGGDAQFTQMQASTSWYFPFKWDTNFHVRGVAGHVIENKEGKLPVFERFFLGGLNTVRGFDYGDISPLKANTAGIPERVGGDTMWYTNLEYIFPLVKEAGLKGVIFFDAGDSFDNSIPKTPFDRIRYSAGVGFRWLSPMGPLRLEWGKNLDPVGDEETSSWDFSIGGSF